MPNDHASLLVPTHEACGRDLAAGRCNPLPKYVAPMRREVVLETPRRFGSALSYQRFSPIPSTSVVEDSSIIGDAQRANARLMPMLNSAW